MKEYYHIKRTHSSMMENNSRFNLKKEKELPVTTIQVPLHRIQEQIQLYQWRQQHKSHLICYQWTDIQPSNDKEVVFAIKGSQSLTSLPQTTQIKGSNATKKVIKILDSFKILYDKFGPFSISSEMIAFDSFFEPLVWMNENYALNEYKREHISEQDFVESILNILLKNHDKFRQRDFGDQCYLARGMKFNINQMKQHFIDFNDQTVPEISISKTKEVQKSQDCTLSFTKAAKVKRPKTNPRKDSNNSNLTYPPTILVIKSNHPTKKEGSLEKSNFKQIPTSNTLPLNSEHSDSFNWNPPKNIIDDSFSFEEDLNHLSAFSDAHRLSVSVNLDQNDQPEPRQSQISVPMLSKYMRTVVDSVINPQIEVQHQ